MLVGRPSFPTVPTMLTVFRGYVLSGGQTGRTSSKPPMCSQRTRYLLSLGSTGSRMGRKIRRGSQSTVRSRGG